MKPVTGGKKYIRLMRPETGVHCRMPEKKMISSRPHQKIGIENPISAPVIEIWSNQLPRLIAAITPTGTPISVAIRMAQSPSSTVAGNRVRNSVKTGFLVTSELPRSPCSRLLR